MSAPEDLTAGLTSATPAALSVRPSVGQRTASSRSLPKSTHPRVTIVLESRRIPEQLKEGVKELAENSARGNVSIVEQVPRGGASVYVWVVG